jgi:hypothetical protein
LCNYKLTLLLGVNLLLKMPLALGWTAKLEIKTLKNTEKLKFN